MYRALLTTAAFLTLTTSALAYDRHCSPGDLEKCKRIEGGGEVCVWTNIPSCIYHFRNTRYFCNTNHGRIESESDARAAKCRPSRNRQ